MYLSLLCLVFSVIAVTMLLCLVIVAVIVVLLLILCYIIFNVVFLGLLYLLLSVLLFIYAMPCQVPASCMRTEPLLQSSCLMVTAGR